MDLKIKFRCYGLPLLFIAALFCQSCRQEELYKEEGDLLLQTTLELQEDLARLRFMTDSLWDTTAYTLDKLIPSDFPSIDRNLLVGARNADHIQMFMSFKSLSPEVKVLVQKAGQQDSLLSAKMLSLQENINSVEKEKIHFLTKLAKHKPSLYRHYADQFQDINNSKSY